MRFIASLEKQAELNESKRAGHFGQVFVYKYSREYKEVYPYINKPKPKVYIVKLSRGLGFDLVFFQKWFYDCEKLQLKLMSYICIKLYLYVKFIYENLFLYSFIFLLYTNINLFPKY